MIRSWSIFVLFCIFGYYLIRATIGEIQKREQIEKMDKELRKAYKELRKLDRHYKNVSELPDSICKNYIDLENWIINEEIFLGESEIEFYLWKDYTIVLTELGKRKIQELDIPIKGLPFVVTVNNKVFFGAWFWNHISSEGPDRVYSMIYTDSIKFKFNFPICGIDPRNREEFLNELMMVNK